MLLLSLIMHLHIVDYLVSFLSWDAPLWFQLILLYVLLYDYPGFVPVLSIVWVWQPRDCVREAYKRIGHA